MKYGLKTLKGAREIVELDDIQRLANMNPKWSKIASTLALVTTAQNYFYRTRNFIKNKTTYSVTINSDDAGWEPIKEWVGSLMKREDNKRKLNAATVVNWSYSAARGRQFLVSRNMNFVNESSPVVDIEIAGHKVKIVTQKAQDLINSMKDIGGGGPFGDGLVSKQGGLGAFKALDIMVFECKSLEAQTAVSEEMAKVVGQITDERTPALFTLTGYGEFRARSDIPRRKPESVILAEGQWETIRDDMQAFLDSEEQYNRLDIPWHRGYLFHGPPGSGKTSLVKALSTQFGLDLYHLPLGDLDKDTSLMSLVNEVGPRSILLLEDLDVFHAATEREEKTGDVSLSGLLNALDGVGTPHGLIFVMTTNVREDLDEALIRSGRVDRELFVDAPDSDQLNRMFTFFYEEAPTAVLSVVGDRPASDYFEIFKRHMEDPRGAEKAILELN